MRRLAVFMLTLMCSTAAVWSATSFTLRLHHAVAGAPLAFDTAHYTNGHGQVYTLSMVKYYLSNIRLHRNGRPDVVSHEVFLIDASDSATSTVVLKKVPDGQYDSVSLTIGIDSARNCSGLQRGALDPVRGMFWAWNTGYIFLKVEGTSPASTSPGRRFEFHVGGFRHPFNSIRTMHFSVAPSLSPTLDLTVDVGLLLMGIDLRTTSVVNTPQQAAIITDRYPLFIRRAQVP